MDYLKKANTTNRKRGKRSLFKKLLLSYALVTLIPVLSSIVIYFESAEIIRNEITGANDIILTQVREALDNNFEDMESLILRIALNSRVNTLMHVEELESNYRYVIYELIEELRSYATLNGFIDDYYIYFEKGDFVVAPSAFYKKEVAYETFHGQNGLSYKDWTVWLDNDKAGINLQGDQLYYIDSLPLDSGNKKAKIVINLDRDRLVDIVEHIDWINKGSFFVVDKDRRAINKNDKPELLASLDLDDIKGSRGISIQKAKGLKYVISFVTSDLLDIKYLYIVPVKIFMNKARYVLLIASASLIFTIAAGIFLSFRFAKRDYSSIFEILTMLSPKSESEKAQMAEDEIEKIKESIQNINRELSSHKDIVIDSFMSNLLTGKIKDKREIEKAAKAHNIDFDYAAYAVIIIETEKSAKAKNGRLDVEENKNLLNIITRNMLEEISENDLTFKINEIDERLAILVGAGDQGNAIDSLEEIIGMIKAFYEREMTTPLTIAVSNFQSSVENIGTAYGEALQALDYKMILGKNNIIFYDEIHQTSSHYIYSMEMEYKMINYIRTGDYDNAVGSFDRLFKMNIEENRISTDMAKCLMFDVIGTLIKAVDDIDFRSDSLLWQNENPMAFLMECETIEDMRQQMNEMLRQVCNYVNEHKQNVREVRQKQVISHIEENCHDCNLNVSAIANHFGMSRSYLSKTFKEQNGISILDYINKVRIANVKEYLDKGFNVAEAANEAGYNNSIALIRAFKKYEGITPGEYRKML